MARFAPVSSDLTKVGNGYNLSGLNGTPMIEVAKKTLEAGKRQVNEWETLEPIAQTLISRLKTAVDQSEYSASEAADLLGKCSKAMLTLQQTSRSLLQATEGLTRLALLVEGPRIERSDPKKMTEKQQIALVVGTVKKIAQDTGICPVCTKTVEVGNG